MDTIQSGWNSFQAHIGEYLDMSEKRNIIASLAAGVLVSKHWERVEKKTKQKAL